MSPAKKIKYFIERYFLIEMKSTVAPKRIPLAGNGNNNLYVAFTGASGCGKSTLRRYYIKNSIIKDEKEIITYKKLRAYTKSLPNKLEGEYLELLMHYINQSQEDIERKLEIIKMDSIYKNFLRNKVFLLDTRNIFRNIPNITDFLVKQKSSNFLNNRIIIHFDIEPSELVRRIVNRKYKTGKIHSSQEKLSQNEKSYHQVLVEIKKENHRIKKLEELRIPILRINAKESLTINTQRIDDYIMDKIKNHRNSIKNPISLNTSMKN